MSDFLMVIFMSFLAPEAQFFPQGSVSSCVTESESSQQAYM